MNSPFGSTNPKFFKLLVFVTLPLSLSGYATHLVGKWHLGFYKWPYVPTNRGFDTAYGYWNGAEGHFDHKRDGVVDFRNGTEPVTGLDGKYATYEYVRVREFVWKPQFRYSAKHLTVATQQTFVYKLTNQDIFLLVHKIQNGMFSIIRCCVTCLLDFARRRGR